MLFFSQLCCSESQITHCALIMCLILAWFGLLSQPLGAGRGEAEGIQIRTMSLGRKRDFNFLYPFYSSSRQVQQLLFSNGKVTILRQNTFCVVWPKHFSYLVQIFSSNCLTSPQAKQDELEDLTT